MKTRVSLKYFVVYYFFEIELTHLKQICDNAFAMLIYWIHDPVSNYPQVINPLP